MKRFLLFCVLCVSIFGCSRGLNDKLDLADSLFNRNIDSSAIVLSSIDTSALHNISQKAWYDLQTWRMLELTDIDKFTTFNSRRIMMYYRHFGTKDKKAQAKFYYGRTLQLKGNLRNAMDCYNQSLNLCSTARNAQLYGRTRYHQSELYESVFYDWDDCIRWLEDAKSCFEASGDYERMTMCDVKTAAIMISHGNYVAGASQLDLIKPNYLQECSYDILSKYYFVKLCSIIKTTRERNDLQDVLRYYIDEIPVSLQEESIIQLTKATLGQSTNKGVEYYDIQVSDDGIWNILRSIIIYDLLEFKEPANELYLPLRKYQQKVYEMMSAAISQEVQFSDDKWQIIENKRKITWGFLSALFLFIATVIILLYANYSTIKKNMVMARDLDLIRGKLEAFIAHSPDVDNHMSEYLKERMDIVNSLICYHLSGGEAAYKKISNRMKEFSSTKDMVMDKNAEAFSAIYPKFTKSLLDKNLTKKEIEYCCLYALGMNGKEITSFLGNAGHFNMSSVIRHKLGLTSSDTNLGIYIKRLISEE